MRMLRNAEGHELSSEFGQKREEKHDHHAVFIAGCASSQGGRHFVVLKHYRWAFRAMPSVP